MKSLVFPFAIVAFIGILSSSAPAQENSLLWEISGKDLKKPSYLFGTIHLICEGDFLMPEKVGSALKKTSQLILEINMADPEEMKDLQKHFFSDTPLTEQLNEAQANELDSLLIKHTGMSLQQVDNFKLIAIYSLLLTKSISCSSIKSYEMELLSAASQNELAVDGLETVSEQLHYFEKAFTQDFLLEQFRLFDEYKKIFGEMLEAYKDENLGKLSEMAADPRFMDEKATEWLMRVRNSNWMQVMPDLMKEQSVFFAVGAAHLPGEDGLIALLKKAGYAVNPVFE